nr:Chain C, GLY-VAL-TRP-ILE-ARG-THR-PRO-PRO-ALA [Homo sapiens]
GVWIRTPPA